MLYLEMYPNFSYVNPSFISINGYADVLLVFNISQVYVIFSQTKHIRGSKGPIFHSI